MNAREQINKPKTEKINGILHFIMLSMQTEWISAGKNKQTKKSNKRLAKNKIIAKKRAVVILLLWKYFREIAFICWFKKLSCPYMSDKKKKA